MSLLIAFVISLVYSYLLEKCAGVIVYTFIIGFFIGIFLFGGWLLKKHFDIKNEENKKKKEKAKYYLWASMGTWGIGGILLLGFCCLQSRIRIAIMMIEASADFVTDVLRILFVPIILILVFVIFLIYWVISGALIFSVGSTRYEEDMPFGEIHWTQTTE